MPKNYSTDQEPRQNLLMRMRKHQEGKEPGRAAVAKLPAGIQAWVHPVIDHAVSRGLWKDPAEHDQPSAWAVAAICYLAEHELASFELDLKAALGKP